MNNPVPETLPGNSQLTRIASLLNDQRQAWQAGDKVLVETYLKQVPPLRSDTEAVLGLIYNEITLRQEQGEAPQVEEYLTRFPEFTNAIRSRLVPSELETLAGESEAPAATDFGTLMAQTRPASAGPALPPAAGPQIIAGYEIQGVLGRGGMGVVYKAWQKRLNRLVALKMILGGADAGPEELARFRSEAEAAARLQHPNIVQIYEIGEADGRAYFSLEYVEGGSLAQKLDGTPLPPGAAASIMETLARAMHYAHQRGVVHRDLKPANILLAPDPTLAGAQAANSRVPGRTPANGAEASNFGLGTPKVTDFGLAKRLDVDLKQTQTGAILGTPSYMAPEQATGRIREIGPATDIYALGTILYELLTGRPPFKAANLFDTLQQVETAEPVAPSRLQPQVPRDLETICLKCLRKEPGKRYATAEDLADDLRRFRNHEPIQARPTPLWERTIKWARRRPMAASLVGVSVTAAVLLVALGLWSNTALRAAAHRETQQRLLAEENFRQALDAVDQMLTEVGAVDLADVPQMEPVRKRLLQKALGFFKHFLAQRGSDPAVRGEAGRAYGRLGDILALLEENHEAEQAYNQAVGFLEERAAEAPSEAEPRRELARTQNNRALLLKKLNDFTDAEKALDQALRLRGALAQEAPADPEAQQDLALSRYALGTVLARLAGKQRAAEAAYRQALAGQAALVARFPGRPEYRRDQARTLNNLGNLLAATDPQKAEEAYRQAVAIQNQLVEQFPIVPAYRRELARSDHNLATLLWLGGQRLRAEKVFGEALDLLTRLELDFPTVPAYRSELAAIHLHRGRLLQSTGRPQEAEAAFREALAIQEKLAKKFPAAPGYQQEAAKVYVSLGILLEERRRTREAEAAYGQAQAIQEQLVARFPDVPDYHSDLGSTLNNRGRLLYNRGELGESTEGLALLLDGAPGNPLTVLGLLVRARAAQLEAVRCLRQAVDQHRLAWRANRHNRADREFLDNDYLLLFNTLLRLGRHAEAAAAAAELPQLSPEDYAAYVSAAECLARCVPAAVGDEQLPEARRHELAEAYGRQAVALLRQAVQKGFRDDKGELRKLPAYRPLQQREDFRQLLEELKASTESAIG